MARCTASTLAGLTPGSALMTRDAVLALTPASDATSRSVGRAASNGSALRRTALLGDVDGLPGPAAIVRDNTIDQDYRQPGGVGRRSSEPATGRPAHPPSTSM